MEPVNIDGTLMNAIKIFSVIFSVILLHSLLPFAAHAGPIKEELPREVSTDPDLCAHVPCTEVLPEANAFSERMGSPSYVEAYRASGDGRELIGYVFLSTDIVDIPAYSGKPVVTLLGMDTDGVITGVKVLWHSEPILMVGIPEEALTKFVKQYVGKFVGDKIKVGESKGGYLGVDAISGATVTVIAENRVIMRSGYRIARQVGIIEKKVRPPVKVKTAFEKKSWRELYKEGSIERLLVMASDIGIWGEDKPWMDLYFGYLNLPTIGKNVLGKYRYESLMRRLNPGDKAIFIIGSGEYSFKGSGFVRGAIFDRIQVTQEDESFTFKDLDYYNLTSLPLEDAPEFNEGGIFIIREDGFSPGYPWSLVVLTSKKEYKKREKEFFTFSENYLLPEKYVEGERVLPTVAEEVPWVGIWKDNIGNIVFLSVYLLAILVLFTRRDILIGNRTVAKWTRYAIMAVGLVYVGYYRMASPSVTQAISLTHNFVNILDKGFQWGLFLSDPVIFILWWFVGITIFLWGRGVFCGWICPYGALTEFSYRIFQWVTGGKLKFELPYWIHKRLIYLKYVIFFFLLGISFYSNQLAELYAEVEPFKTAFLVGVFRGLPYAVYFFALLAVCLVVYRFFCKYICPLGAGLAVPSTFRLFGIKRRDFCDRCTICTRECDSQAIDEKGRIDKRECFWCLNCEENFWDDEKCPVLIKEKKLGS